VFLRFLYEYRYNCSQTFKWFNVATRTSNIRGIRAKPANNSHTQTPDCSVTTGYSGALLVLMAHSSAVIKLEGFTPSAARSTHSASSMTFCVLTFIRMLSPINYPNYLATRKFRSAEPYKPTINSPEENVVQRKTNF